jgi:transcriptional regulator with XRE-family HTH domain
VTSDARERATGQRREIGRAIRTARMGAGVTQLRIGLLVGRSPGWVSRLERGGIPGVPLDQLAVVAAVVGLRLGIAVYPNGGTVRDAGQIALLRRFRERIGPAWSWRLEVPMPLSGDRRAVDAVITAGTQQCVVEAVVRLVDLQAQLRAMRLKTRDLGIERLVVVVAATHVNRRVLGGAADVAGLSLPVGGRAALRSLRAGRVPDGDALIFC